MKKLTKKETKEVIFKFFDWNASYAPIRQFEEILDIEKFSIILEGTDVAFHGISGFADHQIGKLIFFDQQFKLKKFNATIYKEHAIAKTEGIWYARYREPFFPYSHLLVADLKHTWKITRSEATGKAIIVSQVCKKMRYRKGFGPLETAKKDFHLSEST